MTDALLPDLPGPVPPEGLSIGDAAVVTGLTIDAIRYYEKQGLLLDPAPRNPSGRRRFAENDLRWLAGLVMLRETGMSIADIRVVAELSRGDEGSSHPLVAELERHRERVLEDLQRTRRHLKAIEAKIAAYRRQIQEEDRAGHRTG